MPNKTTPKAKRTTRKQSATRKRTPAKKAVPLVTPKPPASIAQRPSPPHLVKARYWAWLVYLTAAVMTVLVVSTGSVIIALQLKGTPATNQPPLPTTPNVIITRAPLTNQAVTLQVAARRPWAVVVGNLTSARPQTGLSQADVVFEAPAEAGITRFMGIYQSQLPARVGPVRSARPYFNDWAATYSALYSHSGGSTEALEQLKKPYGNLQDVNEFSNGAAYERDTTKKAPHNLFTGSERFWNYITTHNWLGSKGFIPFVFGSAAAGGVEATNFTIPYEPKDYQVRYAWDEPAKVYQRSVGGKPQLDAGTNQVITTKNAVIMVTDIVPIAHDPLLKVNITTLGFGRAILLRDGQRYEGRWSKPTLADPLTFTDPKGQPLPFATGNTWISVIDHATESTLSHQPAPALELVP